MDSRVVKIPFSHTFPYRESLHSFTKSSLIRGAERLGGVGLRRARQKSAKYLLCLLSNLAFKSFALGMLLKIILPDLLVAWSRLPAVDIIGGSQYLSVSAFSEQLNSFH